jgi:hypothetical protein
MKSAVYTIIKQLFKSRIDCPKYCTTNILPPEPLGMFPFRKGVVADIIMYNTSIPTTSDVLVPNASIYAPYSVFRRL